MYKLCVYAICKNESNNIDKWYDCVKDADLIYLLDTGSTDDTIDKINNHNIVCSQFIQEGNFDFSLARNECLKRARELCDNDFDWIFVSLDLDEFLEEDGINKIRASWSSDYDTLRIHGLTEGEGGQFVDHKVHSSAQWQWKRSIHEIICLPDKKQSEWNVGETCDVTYIHKQDLSKTRDYYHQLLYEYTNGSPDIKTTIYLAWESFNRDLLDDFLKYSQECAELIQTSESDEFYKDPEYLLQCYLNCCLYYEKKQQYSVAYRFIQKCFEVVNSGQFPPFRRLYATAANVLYELQQKETAINLYKECLQIKERPYCWIDEDYYYDDAVIYSKLSNAYFYFSKPKEALAYAEVALSLDPNNELYTNNVAIIREHLLEYEEPVKTNKICVYAICKNEEQFVAKWLDSMQEADYIVVLDTGSTDNTYELLKNDPRVYRIEQKVITPWRFDTARNEGMKLIPDDANILLSVDLDEVLEPGWSTPIREKWINGEHVRGHYRYAWSHNDQGNPQRIFVYDKLHDKNWFWDAAVHELLVSPIYSKEYRYDHYLDLFEDNVYLHHYPDKSKSRSSYLPLLELRVKEDPTDYFGKLYLSHEYNYCNLFDKSNELLKDIIANHSNEYTLLEVASCYLFMGENYEGMSDYDEALNCYNKAISIDKSFREPYLAAAQLLNKKSLYRLAIAYVEEALEHSYRHYVWVERDTSWQEAPDDILSIAYYYMNNKEQALIHIKQALIYNEDDERLKQNLSYIENM